MNQVKWGILSTANIAQTELIPAFGRASNAEVTAIASSSNKAKEIANQYRIPKAYDSYEQLLNDPEIDGVYIPLPNHLHKEWVIKAAAKGKHILCEKPAALHSTDMKEMKEACEEYGVTFMEGFMYYFHPQHNRVKEIIRNGEIGDVKFLKSSFSFLLEEREGNIRMDSTKGGGTFYDIGCYSIHSIRNILGLEPTSVQVHAKIDPTYHVETDAISYLEFENDITAVIDNSFNLTSRQEYEVVGTKGRIIVPRAYRPDWYGGEGIVIVENSKGIRQEFIVADQYKEEVEHISQAILDNTEVRNTTDSSVNNLKVIESCLASIQLGNKEKINI